MEETCELLDIRDMDQMDRVMLKMKILRTADRTVTADGSTKVHFKFNFYNPLTWVLAVLWMLYWVILGFVVGIIGAIGAGLDELMHGGPEYLDKHEDEVRAE